MTLAFAASSQHRNAHAHNDYEHGRPLLDALQHGFTSIEVDVHLRKGELWVAHNRPTSSSQTLEELYLQPMAELFDKHGVIYPNYAGDFFLMIDVKTEAEETYAAIERLLENYLHIMDTPLINNDDDHIVKVFLSGNRPMQTLLASSNPSVALDGRPSDLKLEIPAALMPVISERFSRYDPFTPSGKINSDKEENLKRHINAVHAQSKKVRFWAHPDHSDVWEYLLSIGVDLINSDELEELDAFLVKQGR
jgi:glycerophosphoryl diester phosphodiesterase